MAERCEPLATKRAATRRDLGEFLLPSSGGAVNAAAAPRQQLVRVASPPPPCPSWKAESSEVRAPEEGLERLSFLQSPAPPPSPLARAALGRHFDDGFHSRGLGGAARSSSSCWGEAPREEEQEEMAAVAAAAAAAARLGC